MVEPRERDVEDDLPCGSQQSEITVNPLSPWTLVNRRNFGTDIGQAIYYRVATGSEPATYTWEFRKGSSLESIRATGRCLSFEKEYIRSDGTRVAVVVGAAA
jgi:hypothetical protein